MLTRGFTSSNTSLAEMVAAVTSAAPAADAAGMGLEETTALLGVLAEKGMKGAAAGDALSAMLRHVQTPDAIKAAGALVSAAGDGSLDENVSSCREQRAVPRSRLPFRPIILTAISTDSGPRGAG